MRKAEPLALAMSGLITSISKKFSPLVSFLTLSTNGMLCLFGIDPNTEEIAAHRTDVVFAIIKTQ